MLRLTTVSLTIKEVHIGMNNADKEGTTAMVKKYRNLLKKYRIAMRRNVLFDRWGT